MRGATILAVVLLVAAPAGSQELKVRTTFNGHHGRVDRVAFSPDGRLVASGGSHHRAGEVLVWEAATGRTVATLAGWAESLHDLAFSPGGKRLAAVGLSAVRVWDVGTGAPLANFVERGDLLMPAGLAFSADGGRLAAAGQRHVRLWDVDGAAEVSSFRPTVSPWTARSAAFTADLRTLAAANYEEVELWDTAAGRVRAYLSGHRGQVGCLAYSPDGKTLAAASYLCHGRRRTTYQGELRLWDPAAGRTRAVFGDGLGMVRAIGLHGDGRMLAVLAYSVPGTESDLKLIEIRTGRQRVVHADPGYALQSVAFTADGSLWVTGTAGNVVRVWQMAPAITPGG